MRICHITPHLPPDQAANALLPFQLGQWARDAGDEPSFVAHPPRQTATARDAATLPGPLTTIPWRTDESSIARTLKTASLAAAFRVLRAAGPAIDQADVVHVHGNGLLAEVGGLWAALHHHKPVVLTLYGTEIWHYRAKRVGPDLFTRLYHAAACVTFYSRGLHDRAIALGLTRPHLEIVYPPVAGEFTLASDADRADARRQLSAPDGPLLVNVKRLHPLAGQRFLIDALPDIARAHPDVRLTICGSGALLAELEAHARELDVASRITFTGLAPNAIVASWDRAADAFVLPSLLEACPTVALEALASGTPVISTDSPGGVELGELFGDDVVVTPRENAQALARAIVDLLDRPRRTRPSTADTLDRLFSARAAAARYRAIYERALSGAAPPPAAAVEERG